MGILTEQTMGESLIRYLDIKIHPELKCNKYNEIIVRGSCRRLHSGISPIEKKKFINWKRPSIEKVSNSKCFYNCFPGQDYILHYYKLLQAYYEIQGYHPKIKMLSCSENRTYKSLLKYTNIKNIPLADIYLGYCSPFF